MKTKLLYTLFFLSMLVVFYIAYIFSVESCFLGSCWGNDGMAVWYGLLAVSLWIILIELVKIVITRFFLKSQVNWKRTYNIVFIPFLIITYAMGKINGWNACTAYFNL